MALDLDGTGDFLSTAASPISAYPFTMACWFNADNTTTAYGLMEVETTANNTHFHNLAIRGNAGDVVSYQCNGGSTVVTANTTTTYTAATWYHACSVGRSATSRDVYLNGGGKGSSATSRTPVGMDNTKVGNSTTLAALAGLIAEAAIWSTDLSDSDVLALSSGVSPLQVRPEFLVFYVPIKVLGVTTELVRGTLVTVNGNPTQAISHPGVRSRVVGTGAFKVAAAAATVVPQIAYHERRRRVA